MSRIDVLTHLALIPQDVPDIVDAGESLKRVYDRHFPEDGGLATVDLTPEEDAKVSEIVAALTPEGSQAAFDPTRLIGIVVFLSQHPELFQAVLKLLRKS